MKQARIALLGAGYTLDRVAFRLGPDELVLTTTSNEKSRCYLDRGYRVEKLDISDQKQVQNFFLRHPALEILVDSIPPIRSGVCQALAGIENITQALGALSHRLKRIVYLSTTGVYGVDDGSWVDETRQINPQTERGRERADAERLYREFFPGVSALRIAAIYGPGRGIGLSLRAGRYPYVENGMRWSNRIHVEDLAQAITAVINFPDELPAVINLADDLPSLTADVVKHYCERFNLQLPESISLDQAKSRGLEMLLSNQRISNELMHRTFGIQLTFPTFREGAGTEF